MPQPGYPLPAGELGDDEIVCQLVYLPDRPEYWQAFLGALSYMTTWRAWERGDDKRGKDAASNWREAFELTMECWRMTCLEDLKSDVADILALMQASEPCCIENTTYGDQTTYITIIVPGAGDAPDYYGETAVSDWDDWLEYLCFSANSWVDELVSNAQNIELALSIGGLGMALLAYAFGAFNFLFMGGNLNNSTLALRVVNTIAGYAIGMFSDAADDIEDARDAIVCAILSGRDVANAVETALSSGDAWDLIYQFIDYDSAIAVLYEGGDGEDDYLEAETDDTCLCECLHFQSKTPTPNPVIYQHASGAQWQMEIHDNGTWDEIIVGTFRFNVDAGASGCGPEKIIDTISVSDGLDFTQIKSYGDLGNLVDVGYDPGRGCNYDITLLEGIQCRSFYLYRAVPGDGGCAVATITITVTYHDV